MNIKVKGPIVIEIEISDIDISDEEIEDFLNGLTQSLKQFPTILDQILGKTFKTLEPPRLKAVPLELSKEELVAFATQATIESLEILVKDLKEVLDRRKKEPQTPQG